MSETNLLAYQTKIADIYTNLVFLPDIREMCVAPCRARLMKGHRVPPSMHTIETSSGTLIHTEILHEQLLNKCYHVNAYKYLDILVVSEWLNFYQP